MLVVKPRNPNDTEIWNALSESTPLTADQVLEVLLLRHFAVPGSEHWTARTVFSRLRSLVSRGRARKGPVVRCPIWRRPTTTYLRANHAGVHGTQATPLPARLDALTTAASVLREPLATILLEVRDDLARTAAPTRARP
ncbi:MAG: hypothetical protein KAX77_03605 [Xanthomonadales bacterium]|nr:hypothetical protein [Xanthomonadales bacterium]